MTVRVTCPRCAWTDDVETIGDGIVTLQTHDLHAHREHAPGLEWDDDEDDPKDAA